MANTNVQISILVVDDDPICLAIVTNVLQKLNHHVVAMKNPVDALYTLRMKYESFDLILTDVHMPEMSGLELLKHSEEQFKLPVVLMSADTDKLIMLKGLENGAAFYLVKPIARDNLEILWHFAISGNNKPPTFDISPTITHIAPFFNLAPLLKVEEERVVDHTTPSEKKRDDHDHDHVLYTDQMDQDDGLRRKKPKLVWTTSLHNRFLEAVNKIGLDKAVPKKILEYMNVEGLKRENVASHLQKYRIFLKRISEATSMQHGVPNNWNERPFRSSFVLNEITFLTNNFQQQYQQLLSKSKGKGTANDTNGSTSKKGQSIQEKSCGDIHNPNKKTNNCSPSSDMLMQLSPIIGTRETHEIGKRNDIEPTSHGGTSSNFWVEHLQNTTNNYVGLRINTNGELIGTLKDTGGDGLVKGNAFSSWDNARAPPPPLLGMDNKNVEVYIPNVVDNANNQHETCFETAQEMLSSLDLSEELRQIGIDIHADQEVFGGDFSFGSNNVQSNARPSVDGVDQGIFDTDDFSLDYYYMQEEALESFLNFNQDGVVDFTEIN